MARLTAATRSALPASAFAMPGRKFPVEDKAHAKAALSRASHKGPAVLARVRRKVKSKFPGIHQSTTLGAMYT